MKNPTLEMRSICSDSSLYAQNSIHLNLSPTNSKTSEKRSLFDDSKSKVEQRQRSHIHNSCVEQENNSIKSLSGLPSIVEQSLSRYVAINNLANQQNRKSHPINVDQPIDLSSKKCKTDPETSTRLLIEPATNPNTFSPQKNLIKQNRITEQIVQNLSKFEPNMDMINKNLDKTLDGHQLYRNVRQEEFTHLAPGVQTPNHIHNVVVMNNFKNPTETNSKNQTNSFKSQTSNTILPINNHNGSEKTSIYFEEKAICPICMKQFNKQEHLRLHM
ncbi:hypothetical protein QR98_0044680 [Sarcoptes scabiei]|uniref:Uncharacterized protein n=1 Tax=Sarcoptes scabiei TaxID=52283 RepID=A0A132A5U4_SARSC|nr:hypothetical protein QR98_0044680 [Sarcoptes scabiei]